MLSIKNLNYTVDTEKGQLDILKNINLDIEPGKFVVITGPNGGGKTTLAKAIMGVIPIRGDSACIQSFSGVMFSMESKQYAVLSFCWAAGIPNLLRISIASFILFLICSSIFTYYLLCKPIYALLAPFCTGF